MRDNGHTILFISHHLDEVLALSDRITVLRKGVYVDTVAAQSTTERELAALMVGREVLFYVVCGSPARLGMWSSQYAI